MINMKMNEIILIKKYVCKNCGSEVETANVIKPMNIMTIPEILKKEIICINCNKEGLR